MQKYAFKMRLKPGMAEEYQKRHDAIWPELVTLLGDAGVSDYSIFLDEDTNILFGVLWRANDHQMEALPSKDIMRRWWAYMADLMQTKSNNEPVATALPCVFHMP